ncbi:MAG TPA: hypothetical protein VEP69_02810, partial [Thermodesulfovibrionales bacterium]|nr:hypothetical protein [Thermodesulfovibrionales bacterium]
RYYVVLATGIVGAQNARRIEETPAAVVNDGDAFVGKLLEVAGPEQDGTFRDILEACLIEMLSDELRYCCANCRNFQTCLDLESTPVGTLFRRRAEGEDTDELRSACARQVGEALQRTPYTDTDIAHMLCGSFRHQYAATSIGGVFNRYADIAAELQRTYGIDYRKIQGEMLRINMDFVEKSMQAESRKQG